MAYRLHFSDPFFNHCSVLSVASVFLLGPIWDTINKYLLNLRGSLFNLVFTRGCVLFDFCADSALCKCVWQVCKCARGVLS